MALGSRFLLDRRVASLEGGEIEAALEGAVGEVGVVAAEPAAAGGAVADCCGLGFGARHCAAARRRDQRQPQHRRDDAGAASRIMPRASGAAMRCAAARDRGGWPARVVPDEVADRDEIGAGRGQRRDLVEARGKADAGNLEHLRPPGDPLDDRVECRPPAVCGLAEHHVVGAALGRDHGVVPRLQPAAARDALGLEAFDRGRGNRRVSVRCAPSAPARATISGWPSSRALRRPACTGRKQRLDAVDQRALVGRPAAAAARRRCRRRRSPRTSSRAMAVASSTGGVTR